MLHSSATSTNSLQSGKHPTSPTTPSAATKAGFSKTTHSKAFHKAQEVISSPLISSRFQSIHSNGILNFTRQTSDTTGQRPSESVKATSKKSSNGTPKPEKRKSVTVGSDLGLGGSRFARVFSRNRLATQRSIDQAEMTDQLRGSDSKSEHSLNTSEDGRDGTLVRLQESSSNRGTPSPVHSGRSLAPIRGVYKVSMVIYFYHKSTRIFSFSFIETIIWTVKLIWKRFIASRRNQSETNIYRSDTELQQQSSELSPEKLHSGILRTMQQFGCEETRSKPFIQIIQMEQFPK